MQLGVSWDTCRGPLGGLLEASWGGLCCLFGAFWGPWGASRGPLEGSLGHLGVEGSKGLSLPPWGRL
eukprot:1812676-Pyramimonas_sp.AAC.1